MLLVPSLLTAALVYVYEVEEHVIAPAAEKVPEKLLRPHVSEVSVSVVLHPRHILSPVLVIYSFLIGIRQTRIRPADFFERVRRTRGVVLIGVELQRQLSVCFFKLNL